MRRIALLMVAVYLAGACGGSGGAERADDANNEPRVDANGNPIEAGQDWSGVGGSSRDEDNAAPVPTAPSDGAGSSGEVDCGVPTTTPEQAGLPAPPGFDPDEPLSDADDDFPIRATLNHDRGDRGTLLKIDVTAVGQPNALVVVLARFYDGDHHGLRGAKFTDVAGRATLEGPVPESAPFGIVKITVTASTEDGRSALEVLDFVVTGPGCP